MYSDRHRIFEKFSELTTATTTEIRMITTPFSFERIPNHYVEGLTRKTEAGTTIQAVVSRGQAIEPTI